MNSWNFEDYPRRAKGTQWKAHTGKAARLRNLRKLAQPALKLKDAESKEAIERIRRSVAHEPEPEYALYHLIAVALEAAKDTMVPFHQSANFMMDRFDQVENNGQRPTA